MSEEANDKAQWEARNFYPSSQPSPMASQSNNENYNYTLLTDCYGNMVRVYGLNLEHRNPTYDLFKSQGSTFVQPNNFMSSVHNNYPGNMSSPLSTNSDRNYWENQGRQQVEDNFYNSNSANNQQDASEYNNPILNRLVGDWTPGTSITSIYGDCINNSNTLEQNPGKTYETQSKLSNSNSNILLSEHNDKPGSLSTNYPKKPRIVAEVKPMTHRLSYSDVLSKNVPINNQGSSFSAMNNNANSTSSQQPYSATINPNPNKKQQMKTPANTGLGDKKLDESGKFRKQIGINGTTIGKLGNNKGTNEINNSCGTKESKETKDSYQASASEPKNKKKLKATKSKPKSNQTASKPLGTFGKFQQSQDFEEIEDPEEAANNSNDDNIQYENMYNVRKNDNYEKTQSKSFPQMSNKKAKGSSTSNTRFNNKQEKSYSKRSQKTRKSQRYQFFEKMCLIWLEYITKLVVWLWSLVSDVIYLSAGIVTDKVLIAFQYVKQFFASVRAEIGNNTNRPTVWIKYVWNKFDSLFSKQSKFAFWRKSFLRKPVEPIKDYYKDGKLPTTADEAMLLLLNCKGKDAYSILGVTPDCPQEQIRKHFHKIALLVHPDKNKQVGSEEAFKVLQRSFELIGEPENRKQYDQSLAEALNAEKAWSELNDLLKQLHTKISEAANTIRCSSCCSRHPRKPTGRPHYAARECNSCRIRHSAREGDIWAETTFFGLRWKYLALMEGNVYDITEWANCQKGALSHLQPNSHIVQYRIVLGQNNQQQQSPPEKEKFNKREPSASDSTFDDILSNIYSGQNQQSQSNRRRHKKN